MKSLRARARTLVARNWDCRAVGTSFPGGEVVGWWGGETVTTPPPHHLTTYVPRGRWTPGIRYDQSIPGHGVRGGANMASETWTVRRLLEWTEDFLRKKQVESPRLEAQILLAHTLGCA